MYESMYHNTHEIADAIAAGLRTKGDVTVLPTALASLDDVTGCDLLVVGAPTHVHRLPTARTRRAAIAARDRDGSTLQLDPHAADSSLREWLHALPRKAGALAAAFDTRMTGPATLTGRASRGIARQLRRHGATIVDPPTSFLVDHSNHLVAGESDRAETWGRSLAARLGASLTGDG